MKRNLIIVCALALAGGVVAAGCGGGNDDESSDTGTQAAALTKEQFIAQGDSICKQSNKEIEAAGQNTQGAPGSPEFDTFVTDVLVPGVQSQIDGIRDLTPPEGDEDTVNSILDAAQKANDEVADDPSSVAGNNDPFADANQQAKAYGFKECGQ